MFNIDLLLTKQTADDPVAAAPGSALSAIRPRPRLARSDDIGRASADQLAPPPAQRLRTDAAVVEKLAGGNAKSSAALEQRYAKMASSKVAKRLPKNLETRALDSKDDPLTLTPLGRQVEQHEIGAMLMNQDQPQAALGKTRLEKVHAQDTEHALGNGEEGTAHRGPLKHPAPKNHPVDTVAGGQGSSGIFLMKRRKKKKKLNAADARAQMAASEAEEVLQGRQVETSAQAKERVAQLADAAKDMHRAVHQKKDQIDPAELPHETLAQYRASDDAERWFLASLKEVDRHEDSVVHRLPPPTVNQKFLAAMSDSLPFYDSLIRYYVRAEKPIPVPATYNREYCQTLLREAIPERGERPCRLAAHGTCESLLQFGFACRERMHEDEYRNFVNLRLNNPQMAYTALPMIQRMCLPCTLCHVTIEYMRRLHKKQHKDPSVQMPDGTSETYDDTEPICDFQMDVTTEGQYDIWACVGVGDAEYLGLPGPVLAWDPSNYVPGCIKTQQVAGSDKRIIERAERIKRAVTERREREGGDAPGLDPHDYYRELKGRPRGFKDPVAVFQTPARTPIPGHLQTDSAAAAQPSKQQSAAAREIRVLHERDECLRFRDGVMPVKVEIEHSPPSTPTSWN